MSDQKTKAKVSGRVAQIFNVMRRHSFLSNFLHQQNPVAVRETFEELGPTFIKLGQLLSTRPDLISPDYIKELRKLQNHVAYDPYEGTAQLFKEETGQSIDQVFKSFDQKPFASASIAQAYHATLKDGTAVVVKVQHPTVSQLVHTDLHLFARAIRMFHYVPVGDEVVDPQQVFNELSKSLLAELDFKSEARNGERFYSLNNGDDILTVPRTYSKISGDKILVVSSMPGKSINALIDAQVDDKKDPQGAKALKDQKRHIAHVLVRNFIKQVFTDHFFHADPHPGNILYHQLSDNDVSRHETVTKFHHDQSVGPVDVDVSAGQQLPPYRISYIDFGMMGTLSANMADGIAQIVVAITLKDTHAIGQAILAVCEENGPVDEQSFYQELGVFLRPYLNSGLGDIDFTTLVYSIIRLCRRNHLAINSEVTMLVRAFASLEGTVAKLDPHISMMEVARPFAKQYFRKKLNWRDLLDDSLITGVRATRSVGRIPSQIQTLLESVNDGSARLNLHYSGQDALLLRLERMMNRLMIVIILAAVILGSSLLVEGSTSHPVIFKIGVAGFCISIAVIVCLLIGTAIHRWRLRRHRK